MAEPKALRAVVATRISVLTDATTAPDSQHDRGEAEAERRGMHVVGHASDLDVSATKVNPWERGELGWWLRHPELFDALIFRSIDRLARRMRDFVDLLDWAEKHNIHLICTELDVDFGSPVGKLIGMVLAWFAEHEARTTAKRVNGARTYMREMGAHGHEYSRWPGGRVRLGYRLAPHPSGSGYMREPDPDTGPVMVEGIDRVINKEPMLAIVRDFNKRGIPTGQEVARNKKDREDDDRPRARWQVPAFRQMLISESLRNVVTHRGQVVRGEDGQPLRYGPSLITDEKWHALQNELKRRAVGERGGRPPSAPLLGVLFCATCDERMFRNITNTKRSTKPHVSYRCHTAYLGQGSCEGASVNGEEVEKFVEDEFLKIVGDLSVMIREEDPGEDHSAEIEEIEDSLQELEADRYERGLFRGTDGSNRYARMYGSLETRLEGLRALPSRPPGVRWVDTGLTYRREWEVSDWGTRRTRLQERNVRVTVRGKASDGLGPDRLRFDCRGFTDEQLAEQGHDEINPDW